jgi:uroporphyrinogen decarboxylase
MDPAKLKQRFGRDLVFWGGGVETQTTLPFGSVEDVRREARERVKLLRPGGGYVFAAIHNIQADISPEKVLAVYDAARGITPEL